MRRRAARRGLPTRSWGETPRRLPAGSARTTTVCVPGGYGADRARVRSRRRLTPRWPRTRKRPMRRQSGATWEEVELDERRLGKDEDECRSPVAVRPAATRISSGARVAPDAAGWANLRSPAGERRG